MGRSGHLRSSRRLFRHPKDVHRTTRWRPLQRRRPQDASSTRDSPRSRSRFFHPVFDRRNLPGPDAPRKFDRPRRAAPWSSRLLPEKWRRPRARAASDFLRNRAHRRSPAAQVPSGSWLSLPGLEYAVTIAASVVVPRTPVCTRSASNVRRASFVDRNDLKRPCPEAVEPNLPIMDHGTLRVREQALLSGIGDRLLETRCEDQIVGREQSGGGPEDDALAASPGSYRIPDHGRHLPPVVGRQGLLEGNQEGFYILISRADVREYWSTLPRLARRRRTWWLADQQTRSRQ